MGPVGEQKTTIVRSVVLHFTVRVPEERRAVVERVHGFYHRDCLISQTLAGSRCQISSTLEFV